MTNGLNNVGSIKQLSIQPPYTDIQMTVIHAETARKVLGLHISNSVTSPFKPSAHHISH